MLHIEPGNAAIASVVAAVYSRTLSKRVYPNNPRSTLHSIRFIMNCAYGFQSPFAELIHYSTLPVQDVRFGALREVKVRPPIYRAQ